MSKRGNLLPVANNIDLDLDHLLADIDGQPQLITPRTLGDHIPAGPAGPQGAQGPSGAQGVQGPQGIQGPQGVAGTAGAQGIQGPAGAGVTLKGSVADAAALAAIPPPHVLNDAYQVLSPSPSHIWGWNGAAWTDLGTFQGPQGIQGIQGPAGAAGAQGIQGATGATGAQGIQGVAGTPSIFTAIANQAEAIAGTDNAKGITPLRLQQKLDAAAYTPTDAAIAETMANLWGMDRLLIDLQGANSKTDITAAWNAAMAKVAARSRTCVVLGHGVYNNPNAATLLIPQAAGNLTVLGMGRDATAINFTYTGGDNLRIGTTGGAQIDTVTLAHLALNSPANHATGAVVAIERGNHIWFDRVKLFNGFKVVTLGAASAIANDTQNIILKDVWAQNGTLSNVPGNPTPLVHAVSGAGLIIDGGRWSGAGLVSANRNYCMIRDGGGAFNWDSIVCRDIYGENIGSLVQCLGRGISGLSWLGGNIDCGDGPLNGFEAKPLAGAVAKDWLISHSKIGGIKADMIHMSDVGGGTVYSFVIANNIISDVDGHSIYIGDTGCNQINIHGNMHRGCGKAGVGTSIIRNGMRTGHVFGETARVDSGTAFTVLNEWRGAAAGIVNRQGPIGTATQSDRAFCTAVGGTGSNSGLFSGVA